MITKEQFAELERLARAASPGPWEYQTSNGWLRVGTTPANRGRMDGDIVANDAASPANMAYIAAANPATVLALLDRIAELEQDAARYAALRHALINVDPKGNRGPIEMAIKNLIRQVHAERGVTEPTEDEFDAAIDAAMSSQADTERP
ncbi:ead/Ea22-like family protein [Chromobacterium haemolyticum]|uniref:ead/Ea22-like family protein n=1 Tax=Chromobacterium haemolyticum TaxID=394935 RepID=UPI000684A617|nr:ead/Ea22-like family protein [Chromobacterium haemolyticum]